VVVLIVQIYQIHAVLQILALFSLILGAYYAKKHNLKIHHRFIYLALTLMTIAIGIMLYWARGIPSFHGKLGILIYIYILGTAFSGRLFLKGKIKRSTHKALAISSIFLFTMQILFGIYTYVL